MAFKQMENIDTFLKFVENVAGVPKHESFNTVDLYEGQDPNSVLVCLSSLARKVSGEGDVGGLGRPSTQIWSQCNYGFWNSNSASFQADKFGKPTMGPREAQGEKKEWTDEQLRASEGIIGLQMGSNKGATASGQNFGNTRHIILNK